MATISAAAAWDGIEGADSFGAPESWSPWDQVYLAGGFLPGVCTVSGAVNRKLDVKSAAGNSGASLADMGAEPAKIEITVEVWTREQLDAWNIYSRVLTPMRSARAKGKAQAFSIKHPSLEMAEITQVAIESVGLMEPTGEPGRYSARISCVEWFPNRIATGVNKPKPDKLERQPSIADTPPSKDGVASP